ncbi:hypothetical protein Tco_1427682 [Tanacetum coccineum]
MMSFLKGQGYKNLQKLKYPQMKELYDKVQASIKDSFKDFVPMDSEKEREMLKERDAQRLKGRGKIPVMTAQPSMKLRAPSFVYLMESYLIIHRSNNSLHGFCYLIRIKKEWEIISMGVSESSGVLTLEIEDGTHDSLLAEKRISSIREIEDEDAGTMEWKLKTQRFVIKPHYKIPYELIRGRTSLIDFMKPFGCPVTILNTRDRLGKFDRKADESCVCVGDSHVVAEIKINSIAGGTRDKYCCKPSEEDAEEKPTKMDISGALDKDGKDDQATRSEFERLLQQEKQTAHPNSTNNINTVSTPVSTAGPSCTDDDPSSPVNVAEASNAFEEHLFERFSPFKNAFTLPPVSNVTLMDDIRIFSNAYDDKDVGADADLNNLETTMNVYEHELKGVSNSNSQNIAFLSTEVKGSTLKQSTAEPTNIPKGYTQAASSKVPTAPNYASHSDEIICSFFSQQASMPTTHDDEDLLQIDEDALDESD